jgi:N-acetylglucosaminyldiphosphoundecaprenol N-acetyl-beta-D-mannosaminyltransferase
MFSETVVILGIPIDNLTIDDSIERIFSMIESYQRDHRSRLVATVNVDFVVNTLSWRLSRIRHPELLDILRRADLVTADGMPLVVISKLLGWSLKSRVTGADLVPKLAQEAAGRGKSLYLLGGRGKVAKRAASLLQERNPELIIAGVDSPFVYIEGENLFDAEEMDREIVDRVNEARPDILLIAFGNPKQEVWFNRNRNQLQVPVSIGIGGTFEYIAGSIRRAPLWMQRSGLEWLFRITQDPGRLWKRYVIGFFKFGLLIWPAIIYDRYKRLSCKIVCDKNADSFEVTGQRISGTFLDVITLPGRLDIVTLESVSGAVDQAFSRPSSVVLDFTQVYFVDSTGLGFLMRTLRRAEKQGCELYLVGITSKIRRVFELNRTWDFFQNNTLEKVDEVISRLRARDKLPRFYYSSTNKPGLTVLDFFGRLDAKQMETLDAKKLISSIANDCIINLGQLDFVDSSGLMLLIKIQKMLVTSGKKCVLCALKVNVEQLFRITSLDRLFHIAPDLDSAQQLIERTL